MKTRIVLIVMIVLAFTLGYSQIKENIMTSSNIKWYDNLEEATDIASQKNLPMLVNFTGSDWCIWCQKLDSEVFSKKEFQDYANDNLILVKIDFPKNKHQTVATKAYNRDLSTKFGVRGFPTILLLNSKEKIIAQTGYQQGGANIYVKHLEKLLSQK